MKKPIILAVQLPAPCPVTCSFCRTPHHNEGNMDQVMQSVKKTIKSHDVREVYLTSNGETGLANNYLKIVSDLLKQGIPVAVLCATKASVIPGLSRVEISYNSFTKKSAEQAIKKAKELNIPFTLSFIDDGTQSFSAITVSKNFNANGYLIRPLQKEGRSTSQHTAVATYETDTTVSKTFPVRAYKELTHLQGSDVICINHYGQQVAFLGNPKN
jgi:organic radical activating enzyme